MKIRILVPATSTYVRTQGDLEAIGIPGVDVSVDILSAGPASIESRVDEAFAVPGLIAKAIAAQADGIDAIVIDCMGDPGLGAVREAVGIPVLGVAQTSMAIATTLCKKFGVVTVLRRTNTLIDELVDLYGYSRHYVGSRSVDVRVLDIQANLSRVQAELAQASLGLVETDGAAGIILGCTGFFGCADAIRTALHVAGHMIPIIDSVPLTVGVAATLVRNGLSHSMISYPPHDGSNPFTGFETILL